MHDKRPWYVKKRFAIPCIFILWLIGILIVSLLFKLNDARLGDYSQVAIAVFAFFALGGLIISSNTFDRERMEDANDRIFALVKFLRKEIIDADARINELFKKRLKEKRGSAKLPRIILKDFNAASLALLDKKQKDEFAKTIDVLLGDMELTSEVTRLLNGLEDFATQLKYTELDQHEAFDVLKQPFVEAVICHSVLLFLYQMINKNQYGNTVTLYKKWLPAFTDLNDAEVLVKIKDIKTLLKGEKTDKADK